MAEMVVSAVVNETVNRISTFLIDQKTSERDDNVERLEMAHIKMEAALHMSDRWQITDVPMLRWRSKLKRAAQECDDALRHCKQRALEDQDVRRRSSFPRRIAHAAKSFLYSSFSSGGKDVVVDESSVNVRRFERFAEGTSEFLRFVEFGGTPRRRYTFFNPLIGDLLAGKTLRYQALQGGKFYYLGIRPTSFAERGVEAMVGFVYQDLKEPAKGLNLRLMLRLSESSDVFGIIIRCLQAASATPHFKIAAEDVTRKLVQLPTQDFSWATRSRHRAYWIDVHNTLTQWLRPDPLCCCNEHEHAYDLVTCSNSMTNESSSSSRSGLACPEEVIVVYLQWYILLSDEQKSRLNSGAEHGGRRRSTNSGSDPLKLAVLFIPHDSPEDIEHAAESYAFEVIDGKEQEMVHRNACLQDVDEKLLPKAIDYLCQNSESRMYQMCLRSRHGTAHLCVEKTIAAQVRIKTARSQSHVRNKGVEKRELNSIDRWREVSRDLLKLWVVRASDKLHGSIKSWIVNSPRRN